MNGEEVFWKPWGDLLNCVKTGDKPFNRVFGMSFWEYLTRNAEAGTIFNKNMSANTEQSANAVVEAYDFSGVNRVIDLAGGRGALIAAILKRYPQAQGVLTDLPPVANEAKAFIESEGLEDRCEIISDDYFESVPSGADIYILKSAIVDEEYDGVVTILKNCRRAMGNHARLLIVEQIVSPHGSPSPANVFDVQMMITHGGLLRTEEEYGALFEKVGFKLNRVLPTRSQFSIIEGVPV
jgi:cyclopropane fatty-acyl-phospholipid synthase-like methyltransferase